MKIRPREAVESSLSIEQTRAWAASRGSGCFLSNAIDAEPNTSENCEAHSRKQQSSTRITAIALPWQLSVCGFDGSASAPLMSSVVSSHQAGETGYPVVTGCLHNNIDIGLTFGKAFRPIDKVLKTDPVVLERKRVGKLVAYLVDGASHMVDLRISIPTKIMTVLFRHHDEHLPRTRGTTHS